MSQLTHLHVARSHHVKHIPSENGGRAFIDVEAEHLRVHVKHLKEIVGAVASAVRRSGVRWMVKDLPPRQTKRKLNRGSNNASVHVVHIDNDVLHAAESEAGVGVTL